MFQASGRLQYGIKPVPGASFDDLDIRRLRDYFVRVLGGKAPADGDVDGWQRLLINLDLMTVSAGKVMPTIAGMLLLGLNSKRFIPQSGIRAVCYTGIQPDYATRADEDLKAPMVPLTAESGSLVESGIIEQVWDFVRRNTAPSAHLEGGKRVDRWDYPEEVIRETIVNALVHRDYSIAGSDISLAIFTDRLEIQSPGRLPNTVTLEGMRSGMRYARNQILVNVMRDYRYVDARGMGVRNKIIPGMMKHNSTEPEFVIEESRIIVRLWKEPRQS
jgi:ATP-dependent DNA helicase RecG